MAKKKVKDEGLHPTFKLQAKEYTRIHKELSNHFEDWIPTMRLQDWDFDAEYVPSFNDSNRGIRAMIQPQYEYRTAQVRFYIPAFLEDGPGEIESTVVHELCHCLVAPMETKSMRREDMEFCVVNLTKAFMRAKYDPYDGPGGK